MECFAGFLSHADEQIGRVLGFLADTGDLDNTIVVVVSDNGASAEGGATGSINDVRLVNLDPAPAEEMFARLDEIGGPLTHNNYPWGWTMAGNTPFRRWKREVHEGGVADPCIVSWAARVPGRRRDPRPVHARHRRRPDAARARRDRLPGRDRRRRADRGRRRRASPTCSAPAASAPPSGTPRSTSRCSARGPSTTSGWKAVTFHPVGPLYDDQDPNAPFDDGRLGAVPRRGGPVGDPRPRRRSSPSVLRRAHRPVVGGGGAQPGAAARQPGAVGAGAPQARSPAAARGVPLLPRRRPRCRSRSR